MIRALLVDDQELVREGLRSLIATDPGLTVVGECADGDEVINQIARTRPDVVVVDIRMQRVDGATATANIRAVDGPPVLVLTTYEAADALFVSEATIKTHLERVLVQLGLRDRIALVVFAHDYDIRWADPAESGPPTS